MGTNDGLPLIYNYVLALTFTSGNPLSSAAIGGRKFLHATPHASILNGIRRRTPRGRTLRFNTSYLFNFNFHMRVGLTLGALTHNNFRILQRSVVSLRFFNPRWVSCISTEAYREYIFRFTRVYVSISSKSVSFNRQGELYTPNLMPCPPTFT